MATETDNTPEGVGPSNDGSTEGNARERISQAASGVAGKAKDTARRVLSKSTERIGNSGYAASSALRRAAAEVDDSWVSAALQRSADGIEAAAQSLSGRDLSEIAEEVDAFARRQPALFLGASLALGFVAARLAKTALEQTREPEPATEAPYQGLQPGI